MFQCLLTERYDFVVRMLILDGPYLQLDPRVGATPEGSMSAAERDVRTRTALLHSGVVKWASNRQERNEHP